MKDVKFARGAVINLASVSTGAVRVNLDGCLSTDSAAKCRGNDSILVYWGEERTAYESRLQPFTGKARCSKFSVPRLFLIAFSLPASPPLVSLSPVLTFLLLISIKEYLYRVTASHEGGSVHSDWSRGRTTGAGKECLS